MKRKTLVLLVDDEPIIVTTLKTALVHAGYEVATVSDGTAAAATLEARRPDVLVTDVAMEGMDGLDLLKRAKELDPDIAVILMTGYCDAGSAIQALRLGADDYLSKPFDFEELLLRVGRCAEKRELRRKLASYEHLSVCASCRRIRDDSGREPGTGEWMPLEEFLSRVTGVPCSHDTCPQCEGAARS